MKTFKLFSIFLCFVLLAFTMQDCHSQSSAFEYDNQNFVRLEMNKLFFSEDVDLGFFTLTNYLNGQVRLNNRFALGSEIPIGFYDLTNNGHVTFGNIQLTLNYFSSKSNFQAELSLGLPTAGEKDEGFVSYFGDITERLATFNPFVFPIKLMGVYHNTTEKGFRYLVRGGFELLTPQEDGLETDLLFDLNVLAGYQGSKGQIMAGLSTVTVLTEEDVDFSERMLESIIISGELKSGNFRPGLVIRIPLDSDLSDIINMTAGLSLAYVFD